MGNRELIASIRRDSSRIHGHSIACVGLFWASEHGRFGQAASKGGCISVNQRRDKDMGVRMNVAVKKSRGNDDAMDEGGLDLIRQLGKPSGVSGVIQLALSIWEPTLIG
jgi:hypothetical protein